MALTSVGCSNSQRHGDDSTAACTVDVAGGTADVDCISSSCCRTVNANMHVERCCSSWRSSAAWCRCPSMQ